MPLTLLRALLAQNKHNDLTQNQKTGPHVTCGTDSYLKWQVVYYSGFGSPRRIGLKTLSISL
jgi:hypothetical protein